MKIKKKKTIKVCLFVKNLNLLPPEICFPHVSIILALRGLCDCSGCYSYVQLALLELIQGGSEGIVTNTAF